MSNQTIRIRDYTINPGDPESGLPTDFLVYIIPAIERAIETDTKVILDLDGTIGYSSAWLKSAFKKLILHLTFKDILGHEDFVNEYLNVLGMYLEIKSDDEPWLIDDIRKYIIETLHGIRNDIDTNLPRTRTEFKTTSKQSFLDTNELVLDWPNYFKIEGSSEPEKFEITTTRLQDPKEQYSNWHTGLTVTITKGNVKLHLTEKEIIELVNTIYEI